MWLQRNPCRICFDTCYGLLLLYCLDLFFPYIFLCLKPCAGIIYFTLPASSVQVSNYMLSGTVSLSHCYKSVVSTLSVIPQKMSLLAFSFLLDCRKIIYQFAFVKSLGRPTTGQIVFDIMDSCLKSRFYLVTHVGVCIPRSTNIAQHCVAPLKRSRGTLFENCNYNYIAISALVCSDMS